MHPVFQFLEQLHQIAVAARAHYHCGGFAFAGDGDRFAAHGLQKFGECFLRFCRRDGLGLAPASQAAAFAGAMAGLAGIVSP